MKNSIRMILASCIIAGSMLTSLNPALAHESQSQTAIHESGPIDGPSDAEIAQYDHHEHAQRHSHDDEQPASSGSTLSNVVIAVVDAALGAAPASQAHDHEFHHSAEWRYYARRAR